MILPEAVALSRAVISDQPASSDLHAQNGDSCTDEENHGDFEVK